MIEMPAQIDKFPLVYVRHKMDSSAELFQKWFDEGLVVLHYEEDLPQGKKLSINPEDYNGPGKKAMKRLWNYCNNGALVVADYSDYGLKGILIGVIHPNSKIEPRKEPYEEYIEGVAYYKVVKLDGPVRLDYADPRIRPLVVLQPRSGTVVRWSVGSIEKYVKYLYKTIILQGEYSLSEYPPEDYPFTDYQWEVLCSEYLRRGVLNDIRIDYLLTPVGRTMKDIDIDGASRNNHILGQVSLTKNLEEIERKIQTLKSYAEEHTFIGKKIVLVYFGPKQCEGYVKSQHQEVNFVSTKEVLDKLRTTGILEDMLPLERKLHPQ